MSDIDNDAPPPAADFREWIEQHRDGVLASEVTAAMAEVAAAVMDTGKKGKVTLTIDIGPLGKGSSRTLIVGDDVKTKVPEHDREEAIWYADDDGGLHKNDPAQLRMELRDVDEDTGEVRALRQVVGDDIRDLPDDEDDR